jgi:succinate dehydrogenase assembly factor 1
MARLSGLQKDVLSLYRRCLRSARTKPSTTRPNFEGFARQEFEKNIGLDKKDFGTIEFLLRKGTRQCETYEAPNITNIAGWT